MEHFDQKLFDTFIKDHEAFREKCPVDGFPSFSSLKTPILNISTAILIGEESPAGTIYEALLLGWGLHAAFAVFMKETQELEELHKKEV